MITDNWDKTCFNDEMYSTVKYQITQISVFLSPVKIHCKFLILKKNIMLNNKD